MLEVTDTQTDISRHFHPCFLLCPSFPFIYAYVGTFEFIRYRFLKSPSSFFCCLSSFISSLSGTIFVFGLISNDSIIFVSAFYHFCICNSIYMRYIPHMYAPIFLIFLIQFENTRMVDSIFLRRFV